MDIFVNKTPSLGKRLQFHPIKAFGFENREEIFCRSVVVWISTS